MLTYENTKTIKDLVLNAGKFHGERTFLRYEDNDVVKDISYEKFAKSCEALAGWIDKQELELGHRARIGVLGGSSYYYLTALFGTMANGNVVVPLDVQLNMNSLAENVNRADLDFLFYDFEHFELIEGAKELCPNLKKVISLQNRKHVENIKTICKENEGHNIEKEIDPKECAMLLFTSGTTGKGKGVLLSHGNLTNNVFAVDDEDPEDQIYMNVLPVHHIFCLTSDFMMSLKYGNVLCLNQDMTKLAAHIQLFQPTVIRMVPMMAKTLYNKIAVLQVQYKDKSIDEIKSLVLGKNLQKLICGGGYLTPELAQSYIEIGIKIAQGYGMSECSPTISAPDWSRPDKVSSVGKLVERCQVRIVDGEIQVKSPSVMMGYYKDPEETAKTITEDGWLKTGDLGYLDDEGFLFFTGRCKNLIILSNGENVAPEQLENMFVDETLIEDILVYGEDDKICAEVYPNLQLAEAMDIDDLDAAIFEIIQKHNQDLPTYKRILQSNVRYIPFEKTSSRKIIRGKYFEQKENKKKRMATLRKPENDTQQNIFNLVAESLGHQEFGIDTDLYEVGLDSLGSVLLLSSLYDKLHISITLQELSKNPTVEKIEAFANEKGKNNQVDYSVREVYPLTSLQTYFGYILRGNTTSNLPFLYKIDKSVDLEKLKSAIEQVFEVHPELKDIIQPNEGKLMNFRNDDRKIDIPIIKLTDEEWEKEKENLIRPFMYTENENLFHAGIYVTESDNYFFFDLAHIIGDGMSMNIIFEDINAIYKGEKVQRQDYTLYEYILDEFARTEAGEREDNIKYFLKQTENHKIRKSILTRKDCYDLEKGINISEKKYFKEFSKKKILAFCKKTGISENVLFLTAFNYCVSVFANDDDVLSTSIHSGRTDSRWNRITGALFKTYMFRYTRKSHETVPELLQKSAKQILNTMDCNTSNLHADEMFIQYQGDILNIDEIGDAPAELQPIVLDALPFHLQIMSDKKSYYYLVRYWDNRFDKEMVEVFMRCYESILQAMMIESSVRRVKKYIPDCEKPKHFYIEAGKINEEVGFELIPNVSSDLKVKPYVLDSSCQKKPFGGWGDLYIMDYPTKDCVDQMENPYGDGILYQTGLTARITPSGNVELLNDAGRTVMIEGIRGRDFIDLNKVEKVLIEYPGIDKAEAYTYYDADNAIHVGADVSGVTSEEIEKVKSYMSDKVNQGWIPKKIVIK